MLDLQSRIAPQARFPSPGQQFCRENIPRNISYEHRNADFARHPVAGGGDAGQPEFSNRLCFKAGITDPGYSVARDRFRLQQTHLTAEAAEWDELSG